MHRNGFNTVKHNNMKTEIIYGIHPVLEALNAGRRNFFEIYIAQDKKSKRLDKIETLAEAEKIQVHKTKSTKFVDITGSQQHQGAAARVSEYPMSEYYSLFENTGTRKKDFFVLLLDNVLDPNNLGAIIRSAAGAGVDHIIIPKDRSASPTPAVSKASAGALEYARLSKVTNMVNTIKELKQKGLWVFGLDPAADQDVYSKDLKGPVALVIGGEEKGIRSLVKKNCDGLISIPQKGYVSSLNASVAGAVVMYEILRQRMKAS